MRFVLAILAWPAGIMAVLLMASALTKNGSDIQIIGSGVFLTVLVVALGCVGVMARLEEIRDRKKE